jgi:hypothetical protein
MGLRLACAAFVSVAIAWGAACGGRTDVGDDVFGDAQSLDASNDVLIKKDASIAVDAAPDVYVPIGKACGVPDAGPPPVWTPDDSGTPIHPPIMMNWGGITLTNPVLIPMTFAGDDMVGPIEDFIASIGCSSYWRATTSDYGIGDAVMGAPVHMTDKIPDTIDDSAIALFIRQKILNKTIPDAVQGQSLYVIYYPDSTDITLQGEHSCQSFGGYHNSFGLPDGRMVAYAVIPRCGSFDGLAGFDELSGTSSHELLEASTDPYVMQQPAYVFPEGNGIAWGLAGGGEVGDLCIFGGDAFFMPNDFPFYVQHTWVSHAAYQGHDPCQPTTDVYFNAAPTLPDVITLPDFGFNGSTSTTTGIKIGLSQQKTINVTLVSDGAFASTISLSARDISYFMGGPPSLNFNFSKTTGHIGDTVQLIVSRIGTNQEFGVEPFVIQSSSTGQREQWWVTVGDP